MQKTNRPGSEIEPAISKYLHARAKTMGVPVSGTFELTSRCNFNCKMCYVHDSLCTASDELSTAQWLDIAKQSCNMGTLFLLLTGGEPLIRDDFEELYCKIKEMGMIVSINTNASLLSGKYLELFKKNPPSRLNISLYGASDETYEALTGGANYEKVISNIRNAKAAGLPMKINLTITPYNVCDVEKIHAITDELDVNLKGVSYMYPPVRRDVLLTGENPGRFTAGQAALSRVKYNLLHMGKEKFMQYAESVRDGVAQLENTCIDPETDEKKNGIRCRAGSSSFWINYKGEMSPCGMFSSNFHSVLENGVAAAWEKVAEETKEIRLPKECLNCKYKKLCNVCAAVTKSETGEFSGKPEYVCEMTRLTAKYLLEEYEKLKGE